MSVVAVILLLVLVGAVAVLVSGPLRDRGGVDGHGGASMPPSTADGEPSPAALLDRDELEAEREAKYREIRDAELDYRTGKLSRADYEAIDGELRAEAIEILNRLERAEGFDRPERS